MSISALGRAGQSALFALLTIALTGCGGFLGGVFGGTDDGDLTGLEWGSAAFGDVDGDGDLDLVLSGRNDAGQSSATLYLNNGSGGFTAADAGFEGVTYMTSTALADLNGDGALDVVIIGEDRGIAGSGTATAYFNNGSGGFSNAGADLTGVYSGSLATGDPDGDGDTDLLIGGEDLDYQASTTLYVNDGGGSFSRGSTDFAGVFGSSSHFADVDGDGDLDLTVLGQGDRDLPTANVYLNNGSGAFTAADSGLPAVLVVSTSLADVDGDGDLDMVVAGQDADYSPSAALYLNNGSGTFSGATASFTAVDYGASTAFGDVDGDGDPDLVITGPDQSEDPTATLYINDGNGAFTDAGAALTGVGTGSATFADVDGDGDLDLLITGTASRNDASATLYINDGSGTFTRAGGD